jgi:TonB-dependent starch-binding outer membrane protein SusC
MQKLMLLACILFFGAVPLSAFSQARTITGAVKDAKGEPVPMVTVTQKGTAIAVTANENGLYSISVTGSDVTLVFSSVNFETQELKVGSASTYDVTMNRVAYRKLS